MRNKLELELTIEHDRLVTLITSATVEYDEFPLDAIRVKLRVVDTIPLQSNKFVTGMGSKVTDVSKLNDSPA